MENVVDNVIDSTLTGDDPGTVETADGKSFSQKEVNDIIRDRLAKEKDKSERQFETLTKEYERKELNLKAKELMIDKGLPSNILEILKFDDEEMLNKNIQILEEIMKPGRNENHGEPAGFGVIVSTGGSHGSIQQPTADSSIKAAMGLKS